MFGKLRNLDRAFQQVRLFSLLTVAGSLILSFYALYQSFRSVRGMQDRIYVLAQGKAMEAYASNRGENFNAEAKSHIANFHQLFFNLVPDEQANRRNIRMALYLADQRAHRVYSDLVESGYYTNLVSGNVSQKIAVDSIQLFEHQLAMHFRFFGKQTITRSSQVVVRSLITEGSLREIARSDHNPHGLLIEQWKTLENKDIEVAQRNR